MLCIFILYISILTHAPPSPPFLTFGARHSHGCGRLYACSPPGGTQCPPFTVLVLVINTYYYIRSSAFGKAGIFSEQFFSENQISEKFPFLKVSIPLSPDPSLSLFKFIFSISNLYIYIYYLKFFVTYFF